MHALLYSILIDKLNRTLNPKWNQMRFIIFIPFHSIMLVKVSCSKYNHNILDYFPLRPLQSIKL